MSQSSARQLPDDIADVTELSGAMSAAYLNVTFPVSDTLDIHTTDESFTKLALDGIQSVLGYTSSPSAPSDVVSSGLLEQGNGRAKEMCAVYSMLTRGFLVGLTCILGTLGNFLSAYTVWPKVRTQSMSLLILCLAVFDTLFLLSALFNMAVPALEGYFNPGGVWGRWVFPYMYAYYRGAGRIGHYAGTWTIIVITFHRYIAVCHPNHVKRWCSHQRALLQMILLAVVCTLYSLPGFLQYKVSPRPDNSGMMRVKTQLGKQQFWFDMFYETILYFTFVYVIPFPCLLAMTYKLVRSLKVAKQRRQAMTRKETKEYDLTRTLVAVVVVYLISHTPNPIRRGILAYTPPLKQKCPYFYYYFHPISTYFMLMNAACNFLTYCTCGRYFRLVVKARMRQLFSCKIKVQPLPAQGFAGTSSSVKDTVMASGKAAIISPARNEAQVTSSNDQAV